MKQNARASALFHQYKKLYTPEEAAELLSIARTRCFQLMGSGRLRSIRVGKVRRVSAEAIDQFIAELEGEQA